MASICFLYQVEKTPFLLHDINYFFSGKLQQFINLDTYRKILLLSTENKSLYATSVTWRQ